MHVVRMRILYSKLVDVCAAFLSEMAEEYQLV